MRLLAFQIVVPLGFEPRQTEPESVVLPLHNGTICVDRAKVAKNNQSTNIVRWLFYQAF